MRKGRKHRRLLAVLLSTAMLLPSGAALAAEEKEMYPEETHLAKAYAVEEGTGREQVNFNREWKFIRSDVEGAAEVGYDDSAWVDVALPHNFSIPYEMTAQFYVGYGWYRKEFEVPESWQGKKVELEFEGVFQVAEIYVNGQAVGTHEGGYSGFVYDITDYLHTGTNLVAVRVNNIWQHDLAPRSGDHQFTGGIYRDVYLNVTEDVHVTWYGTYVTTPDLTNPGFDESAQNIDFSQFPSEQEIRENLAARRSNVRVQTEVVNTSEEAQEVQVLQRVEDEEGRVAAEFASEKKTMAAGEIYIFDAVSAQISDIELWSPENPYLYKVYTTVISEGVQTDTYESTFGFRWAQYKNDAFYLNGEKVLLDGANAHQDHAGFADAVTDAGFYRDVAMIKECGMNFIRGSHYPHDPSYAEACDELGVLFWCECNFWGMGGCAGKDDDPVLSASDWFKDAYPQNPADEAAFEQSCMDSLEAMIRVNRNHPSVINWSMGNEVFFTSDSTQDKAKALVNKMRNYAHELDPTRKAGMGGCQRQGYDSLEICDIAGYNGDGGKFENTSMPNIVAEYGSKVQDRPGEYRPYYDQIQGSSVEEFVLQNGSAGLSAWCAFHHGTIGGDGLAKMGIIDYYRLPLNTWYWYREKNTGVAPEASVSGTAVKMEITATDPVITNDGKKDTQLIVTMEDADGNWVNDTRKVTLSVKEGPGVFPGGKTYTFTPNKSILDGRAAIEFRSWYEGTTVITAEAEGLPDAEITIRTENVCGMDDGEEPENFYDASLWGTVTEKIEDPFCYGGANAASGRPVFPSSNTLEGELATDGDMETSWTAEKAGSGEYFQIDLEFSLYVYKLKLGFNSSPYPYKVETAMDKSGPWKEAVSYTEETVAYRPGEETLDGEEARYIRITFTDVPENEKAFLSELEVYGNVSSQAPAYVTEGVYLSDVVDYSTIVTGWKTPGKNTSCEGAPIRVGGTVYEKGIGVHANSIIPYETEGKYTRIVGVAGMDDEVSNGNAVFRIYADDKLIYEKELSGGQADYFNLSISGVERLRLETDANGSDSEDHTDWADVRLLGAQRDISLEGSGCRVSFVGMTSGLHAGEDYKVLFSAENTEKTAQNIRTALVLYDQAGKLQAIESQPVKVSAGRKVFDELALKMPSDVTGYRLAVLAWEEESMEPATKCVYVYADGAFLSGSSESEITWEKVDGEDPAMEKTGTWTLWESSDAYMGTETCSADASGSSSLSYSFTGNYVRVGVKIDGSQVGADIYIDDEKVGSINTKAADNVINIYQQAWASEKLADGSHMIKLVPVGKFGLDYLEIGTERAVEEKQEGSMHRKLKDICADILALVAEKRICNYTEDSRQVMAEAFYAALELCRKEAPDEADCGQLAEALQGAAEKLVIQEDPKEPEEPKEPEKPSQPQEPDVPKQPDTAGNEKQPTAPEPPANKVPAVNTVWKSGKLYYKVTKSAAAGGTVQVQKPTGKKFTKLVIPAQVKLNGYSFKVTAIRAKAFQKNSRLVSVTIGKNVTKIGSQAFAGCKKLKKVKITSSVLKKVNRNAFQGIYKKAVINVPNSKIQKYTRTILKKAGLSGTVKVK